MSAPSAELVARLQLLKNSVDVPAGVAAVLEHAFNDVDIEAIGLWVQVPHYVASMAYPAATVALLGGLADISGITISGNAAKQETLIQRDRLDELVAGNDEHTAMVRQLEAIYDSSGNVGESPLVDGPMPTADELGAEFEQFLREQDKG